jgi:hypothetical protein
MEAIRRPRRPGALRSLMRALRDLASLLTHLKMGSSLRHPPFAPAVRDAGFRAFGLAAIRPLQFTFGIIAG